MPAKKSNPIFMNGVPELVILKLISKKEMYGYEIVKTILRSSRKILSFGEGCIYPILHSLEKDKCVKTRNQVVQGRNRIFYKATRKGEARLSMLSDEWTRISQGISNVWRNAKKK